MRWCPAVLAVFACLEPVFADPVFVNDQSGLPVEHIYSGGWEHFVGGGVAAFDCNNDARPDLFAAGGDQSARLFVNQTEALHAIRFDTGALANIPQELLTHVTGAYPIDIDSDGEMDLVVLRVGENVILRGLGNCAWEGGRGALARPPREAGPAACAATWETGQILPTLAFGNYVDRNDPDGPFEACDTSELIRPNGSEYPEIETISPGYCALSMQISDWRRAGTPELRISNDRHYYVRGGYEQMFKLSPLIEREDWPHISLWGMGIASHDITGDGLPEVMTTSMGDQLLQFNRGDHFENAPFSIGTYAQRPFIGDDGRPATGWHAEFGDIDNDSRADLFIAKGNVDQMPSNAINDPNNLLMQQSDGTFVETAAAAGVASVARSRGAALVDLNADGLLDIVVVNRRAPMEIWRNATPETGVWAEIEPKQTGVNPNAVGAWVEVRTGDLVQSVEVTVGGGHAGGKALPLHFGLGNATSAEMRVIWPDQTTTHWQPVKIGALNKIVRD
jgi:hypothetical protein